MLDPGASTRRMPGLLRNSDRVPSVEPPSTTRCSVGTAPARQTLSRAAPIRSTRLRTGVMIEMRGLVMLRRRTQSINRGGGIQSAAAPQATNEPATQQLNRIFRPVSSSAGLSDHYYVLASRTMISPRSLARRHGGPRLGPLASTVGQFGKAKLQRSS